MSRGVAYDYAFKQADFNLAARGEPPYNEVKYLESLRKKRSSLLSYATHNPS